MILGIVPFSVIQPAWVGLWSHLVAARSFGFRGVCLMLTRAAGPSIYPLLYAISLFLVSVLSLVC